MLHSLPPSTAILLTAPAQSKHFQKLRRVKDLKLGKLRHELRCTGLWWLRQIQKVFVTTHNEFGLTRHSEIHIMRILWISWVQIYRWGMLHEMTNRSQPCKQ